MDRNFDGLSERFKGQIYGTLKGQLRLKMLDYDLSPIVDGRPPLKVLDAGGGMGQFSSALAQLGHHVTLADISEEMLVEAQALFGETNAVDRVRFICDPLQALPSHFDEPFDLVLNHAVLEWLENPIQGIDTLISMVKPGGHLSLMFYNRHAIVWRNLMNGSWHRAHNEHFHHDKNALMPQNPLDPQEVLNHLKQQGLQLLSWRGIRCVHDHMPKFMRDKKSLNEFFEIEKDIGVLPPYRDLGRYVHMVCRKPA